MLTPRIAHRGTGPEHGFRSDEGNAEVTELRLACRNPGLNDEKRVLGTNPTGELITSGSPVTRERYETLLACVVV